MNNETKNAIEKFKEVKNILKKFTDRNEAIEYLVSETKLSKEKCYQYIKYMSLIKKNKELMEC